jgi:prevent-host-death family protein
MIATLRETKAKLSEMVKRAAGGEDVLITVHGKKVAKLVGLPKQAKKVDKKNGWQNWRICAGNTAPVG